MGSVECITYFGVASVGPNVWKLPAGLNMLVPGSLSRTSVSRVCRWYVELTHRMCLAAGLQVCTGSYFLSSPGGKRRTTVKLQGLFCGIG